MGRLSAKFDYEEIRNARILENRVDFLYFFFSNSFSYLVEIHLNNSKLPMNLSFIFVLCLMIRRDWPLWDYTKPSPISDL